MSIEKCQIKIYYNTFIKKKSLIKPSYSINPILTNVTKNIVIDYRYFKDIMKPSMSNFNLKYFKLTESNISLYFDMNNPYVIKKINNILIHHIGYYSSILYVKITFYTTVYISDTKQITDEILLLVENYCKENIE